MKLIHTASFAGLAALSWAYQDTSPFFLLSTSEVLLPSRSVASSSSVDSLLLQTISQCSSKTYIIVSQPGVHAEDFAAQDSAPYLRRRLAGEDKAIRSSATIQDVQGQIDESALVDALVEKCGARHVELQPNSAEPLTASYDDPVRAITIHFSSPPSGASRKQKLREHDQNLRRLMASLSDSYTVFYSTTPKNNDPSPSSSEPGQYEMDSTFDSAIHMELKRAFDVGKREPGTNITLPNGGLFERYQYFSPGIFMGLVVVFIILSILYVAISGLASLQISHAAFDKEMGPAAHKKQAQ